MAFDNVTLFEINLREFPFGGETSDETATESTEVTEESTETDDGETGGRGRRVAGLLFGAVILAVVARQVAKRRGGEDYDEFETEEVEPGVERVEA